MKQNETHEIQSDESAKNFESKNGQTSRIPVETELLLSTDTMWVVRRMITNNESNTHALLQTSTNENSLESFQSSGKDASFLYTDVFMLNKSSEPIPCSIDVPTGHIILSYMEKHLQDRNQLTDDWNSIDKYVSEENILYEEGKNPKNQFRNRECAPIPYEQSRVKLRSGDNDYINGSLMYDTNPRNPVYIATITPTVKSVPEFWLMVWEQGCVVIVCLERIDELKKMDDIDQFELNDASVKYWPNEGSQVYGSFEVHLVSEHSWSDNYIIRSFYLKSIVTNETRTVTQFHYLTWKDENLKENSKPMLEFRRDGCGRTGAYILLDLVLNRITKGVKEIDIAASLEHLRDQRPDMIKTLVSFLFFCKRKGTKYCPIQFLFIPILRF
ncbi:receptor-type tyrosine-protein phosphatase N [Schistosoma bovis]|uniref:Receptor-type tyrosine-protein phosphatase N n=1 Tax=Schistosoma bovis TaxID=6184 RepID=A0A430QL56_SCHBO|nr:receptor-type tyrosine-protein phosphatase N [Schistosoma bovis]